MDGLCGLVEHMKAITHGFYDLAEHMKTIANGFHKLAKVMKAIVYGFHNLAESMKAIVHGFRDLEESTKAVPCGIRQLQKSTRAIARGFRLIRDIDGVDFLPTKQWIDSVEGVRILNVMLADRGQPRRRGPNQSSTAIENVRLSPANAVARNSSLSGNPGPRGKSIVPGMKYLTL